MKMTWGRLLLNMLILFAIVTAILVFGPFLKKKLDNDYRKKIDENGMNVKAVITNKKEKKGREIHFRYSYNGKELSNYEDSKFYYELEIRDSVLIRVDSIHPGNSYIVSKL